MTERAPGGKCAARTHTGPDSALSNSANAARLAVVRAEKSVLELPTPRAVRLAPRPVPQAYHRLSTPTSLLVVPALLVGDGVPRRPGLAAEVGDAFVCLVAGDQFHSLLEGTSCRPIGPRGAHLRPCIGLTLHSESSSASLTVNPALIASMASALIFFGYMRTPIRTSESAIFSNLYPATFVQKASLTATGR